MSRRPSAVAGTWPLLRLVLRRDRIRLPVWLIGITAVTAVSANAVVALYDTAERRAGYAATVQDSAVSRLFGGIPRSLDTIGGILAFEIGAVASVAVALMTVFLVVRHTRGEEESSRAELVRSTVVGRHAALMATVLVSTVASLLAGLSIAVVLLLGGTEPVPSLGFGAGVGGVGLVFTGLAAVTVQLAASARKALGIALAVLLVGFLLRGYGALDETWWTWTSPFGWQDELRPFGDDPRWWPLGFTLAATVAELALASWLAAHRDFGAGLVAERAGDERASPWLTTPAGLTFHQQRGLLAGWGVGLVVLALTFGAVSDEIRTMVEGNPELAKILGGTDDLVRGYLSFVVSFLGVSVSAYAVASALRLRHGEVAGQAESLLATGISRTRWAGAGIAVTLVCVVVVLAIVGTAMGASHAIVTGDTDLFLPVIGATMATAPAVLLLASVAFALHGWAPRWALLAWIGPVWAFIQAYLGDLLDLPRWLEGMSPFEHLAEAPAESFEPGPASLQLGLAVLLTVLGVVGLRRRDVL